MRSYLAQLLESFSVYRSIRRKALLFATILTAITICLGFRLSQLDSLFYTPLPQLIVPLALYELGYFEQAAKGYRAAYKQAGKNRVYSEDPLLSALLSADLDSARRTAETLLSANPEDLRALNALTKVAFQANDLKLARELTKQVLSLNEDDTDALMLAALIATRNQSYGEAIGHFDLALRTGETGSVLTFLDVLETAGQLRDSNEPPLCLLATFYDT